MVARRISETISKSYLSLLYGGKGDDSLWGGTVSDTLYGGDGADTFFYKEGDGNDVIADFTSLDKIMVMVYL